MRMYKICHHAAMWYRLYSKSTYWVSQSTYCFWLLLEIACETFPSCWYEILLSTRFSKFYQSWQDWARFREKSKKRPTFGRPTFRPRLYIIEIKTFPYISASEDYPLCWLSKHDKSRKQGQMPNSCVLSTKKLFNVTLEVVLNFK